MTPENGNFWYYLILNLLDGFLASQNIIGLPQHQYWGLPLLVGQYGTVLFVVTLTFLGQFINLSVAGAMLPQILILEIARRNARLIFAVLRFILFKG